MAKRFFWSGLSVFDRALAGFVVIVLLLVVVLSLSGCSSASSVSIKAVPHLAKVHPDEIQVFLGPGDVPGPYDVLGLLTGKGYAGGEKMLKKMKARASKLGANGVILGEFRAPSAGDRAVSWLVGGFGVASSKWEAQAIRFYPERE